MNVESCNNREARATPTSGDLREDLFGDLSKHPFNALLFPVTSTQT